MKYCFIESSHHLYKLSVPYVWPATPHHTHVGIKLVKDSIMINSRQKPTRLSHNKSLAGGASWN